MNIEYRFKVIAESYSVTNRPFVGKISGHRKKVAVSVTRTSATDFRARINIKQWDQMARSPEEARAQWIEWLRGRVERGEADLAQRRDALSEALNEADRYPVRRIQ